MTSACTLKVLRILRVTSPLLIVLVGREESLWVLAVLPFIEDYRATQFNGNYELYGSPTINSLRFGIFPFIPHSQEPGLSLFHLFIGKNCLVLMSANPCMIFDPLGIPISTWCNESGTLDTLVLKNTSSARLNENVSSPPPTSMINPNTGNPNRSTIPLDA